MEKMLNLSREELQLCKEGGEQMIIQATNDCISDKESTQLNNDFPSFMIANYKNIIDKCLNCQKDSCIIDKKFN